MAPDESQVQIGLKEPDQEWIVRPDVSKGILYFCCFQITRILVFSGKALHCSDSCTCLSTHTPSTVHTPSWILRREEQHALPILKETRTLKEKKTEHGSVMS